MFYTYLWLREDGTPYYVGKGTGRRAYTTHRVGKHPPKEQVILQEFLIEKDALFAERFLIEYYGREDLGRGRLLNLSDGGEIGPVGVVHSKDRKPSRLGANNSIEHRKRSGLSLRGNKNGQRLNDQQIAFIIDNAERHYFSRRELAEIYGVTGDTLTKTLRRHKEGALFNEKRRQSHYRLRQKEN